MSDGPFSAERVGTVVVIGAGATGTALAATVGRVAPVVVVCRNPERAAAIFRDGVRLSGLIEAHSRPIVVARAADLATIGGVEFIFVTTKTTSISQVAAELRPVLPKLSAGRGEGESGPYVVSFQNGIEPGRRLIEELGDSRVLRMVLNFGVVSRGPDRPVEMTLNMPPNAIGCLEPRHRGACERVAALLTRAGLATEYDAHIERRVWTKAVLNAAMNPVAALVNATVGEVLDSPARGIVERLLLEALATARAEGLDLEMDADAAWAALERARPHTPSMVEDIRAGRESEVGQLNRQIIEHARRLGVAVPTHEVIDALIETFDWKIYAAGGAGAAAQSLNSKLA